MLFLFLVILFSNIFRATYFSNLNKITSLIEIKEASYKNIYYLQFIDSIV